MINQLRNIPELFFLRFFREAFKIIEMDYKASLEESWLAKSFGSIEIAESNLLPIMVKLLEDHSIDYFYNQERATKGLPTLHIDFPTVNRGATRGLGLDSNSQGDLERAFNFNLNSVVTAKNQYDLLAFCNLLRSCVFVFFGELEFSSYRNVSIAEQAYQFPGEIRPENIYARSVVISGEFDYKMQEFKGSVLRAENLIFSCSVNQRN